MIEGVILTYTREQGLTQPYCAQVWGEDSSCVAIETFVTSQEAYDFCLEKGAVTIRCEIYGQD